MPTPVASAAVPQIPATRPAGPLLEPGDRLTRGEFERRYHRMPRLKKAELIEGTVYMPSPLRANQLANPHVHLATWLGTYEAQTPGVQSFDNPTVRLDFDNEPRPDLVLLKLPARRGQARIPKTTTSKARPN